MSARPPSTPEATFKSTESIHCCFRNNQRLAIRSQNHAIGKTKSVGCDPGATIRIDADQVRSGDFGATHQIEPEIAHPGSPLRSTSMSFKCQGARLDRSACSTREESSSRRMILRSRMDTISIRPSGKKPKSRGPARHFSNYLYRAIQGNGQDTLRVKV